jgi:hypothetical protein
MLVRLHRYLSETGHSNLYRTVGASDIDQAVSMIRRCPILDPPEHGLLVGLVHSARGHLLDVLDKAGSSFCSDVLHPKKSFSTCDPPPAGVFHCRRSLR